MPSRNIVKNRNQEICPTKNSAVLQSVRTLQVTSMNGVPTDIESPEIEEVWENSGN